MLGRKIGIGISEQGLSGGREFRVVIASAQRFAGIGRRSHGVDIGIVGIAGMRVVVEGRDLFNLRQQALINLLHVGAGEGTGLGSSER